MEQRQWKTVREFEEILFEEYNGIAKITINRPQYRNAFTPKWLSEGLPGFSKIHSLLEDIYSFRKARVKGVVANMDAWYDALDITDGAHYRAPADCIKKSGY